MLNVLSLTNDSNHWCFEEKPVLFQGVNKVCQYLFQGVNKVCQYSSVNFSLHLTLRTQGQTVLKIGKQK